MNKVDFRSAESRDLATLYEFEQGVVSAERPFNETLKEGTIHYYDIKGMIEAKDTEVMVAEVDDEIIGSGYVKIKHAVDYVQHDRYAYVGFMYVKPEHRGKGISQMMLEQLKLWAKAKGLQEFRLDVYDANHRAVSAYQKFGFEKHLVEMRMSI